MRVDYKQNPSVMVLVKNDCYWLPYVLKQCEGIFTSFVIYDVGSTDKTPEIIDWWYERNKEEAHIIIRKLPHCPPEVQGTFRNSQIAEGDRDVYFILDGDELYKEEDLKQIYHYAVALKQANEINYKKRYGVFERVEVTPDLTSQYKERRGHHRLYTHDAFWTGTHPGEEPYFKQDEKSELHFPVTCFHMHNTLRSPKEHEALSRLSRKGKRTYHPGNELAPIDIIKELPILVKPIEHFEVCPALAKLQNT